MNSKPVDNKKNPSDSTNEADTNLLLTNDASQLRLTIVDANAVDVDYFGDYLYKILQASIPSKDQINIKDIPGLHTLYNRQPAFQQLKERKFFLEKNATELSKKQHALQNKLAENLSQLHDINKEISKLKTERATLFRERNLVIGQGMLTQLYILWRKAVSVFTTQEKPLESNDARKDIYRIDHAIRENTKNVIINKREKENKQKTIKLTEDEITNNDNDINQNAKEIAIVSREIASITENNKADLYKFFHVQTQQQSPLGNTDTTGPAIMRIPTNNLHADTPPAIIGAMAAMQVSAPKVTSPTPASTDVSNYHQIVSHAREAI